MWCFKKGVNRFFRGWQGACNASNFASVHSNHLPSGRPCGSLPPPWYKKKLRILYVTHCSGYNF